MLRILKYLFFIFLAYIVIVFAYTKFGDMDPPISSNDRIIILKNEN